ncbi:unnamed protein product [Cercopithifilaria johnstoni]|uniref:C6 domain-containing protein n=1 Tax=Cercopithifilaria johnstoni TaxID=2874296 RepID=A0A8J2Q9X3_9BILA|nr:unnamed protein product [Cercopithifilaria johnstoni]
MLATMIVAALPTRSTAAAVLNILIIGCAVTFATRITASTVASTTAATTHTLVTTVTAITTTAIATKFAAATIFATGITAVACLPVSDNVTLATRTTTPSSLSRCDVPIISTIPSPVAHVPTTAATISTAATPVPTTAAAKSISALPTTPCATPAIKSATVTVKTATLTSSMATRLMVPPTTTPSTKSADVTVKTAIPTSSMVTLPMVPPTTTPSTKSADVTVKTAIPTSSMVTRPMVPPTTIPATKSATVTIKTATPTSSMVTRPMAPSTTTIKTTTAGLCRTCGNITAIGAEPFAYGERNGQLTIVYGTDIFGCRIANLICDAGPLTSQTAIIYANGMKSSPFVLSPIGMVQITLTCNENIRWIAPNSRIYISNVTCLLGDHATPTTLLPPLTTRRPCSTCANIRSERVKNAALTESDGRLIIQYTYNEFGCRVATIFCNTSNAYEEVLIYFNEMKNSPVASNVIGSAVISLVCGDNLRFKVEGFPVNVESVTCLSRDIITAMIMPRTTMIMPRTTMIMPMIIPTTSAVPPLCAACENLKTAALRLNPNEINGPLTIEYSKQADGCRTANIICGSVKRGTAARIYFNGDINSLFISDITGRAQIQLICGNDLRWRAFQSATNVASVSCIVIDVLPVSRLFSPEMTISPFVSMPTRLLRCQAQWAAWESWSTCTDTCGAYGSRQRFRGCQQTYEDCFCNGYFFL